MRRSYRTGESFAEYGLLLAVVVAGLLGVQQYLKRAIEGRLANAGAGGDVPGAVTYVPQLTNADLTTSMTGRQVDEFTQAPNNLNPDKDVATIFSDSTQERTVNGTKLVDEQPFWRLFD